MGRSGANDSRRALNRIQRNFEPLQRQVELWRNTQATDERAKLIFYSALIDGSFDAPRSLLPEVHRLYFEPEYPEFSSRTMWSLSNAFTSAFNPGAESHHNRNLRNESGWESYCASRRISAAIN